MTRSKLIDILPAMPKESYGKCIAVAKDGKICSRKGELADGLCMKYWDKFAGYKNDIHSIPKYITDRDKDMERVRRMHQKKFI